MPRTSTPLTIRKLMRAIRADGAALKAFSAIADSLSRRASGQQASDIDRFFDAAFTARPAAAQFVAAMVAQAARDPAMSGRLTGADGAPLSDRMRGFDPARALDRVGDTTQPNRFDGLFRQASAKLDKRAAKQAAKGNQVKDADQTPKVATPGTSLEVTRPDGTKVKVTSQGGEGGTTTTTTGNDDRPKGPSTTYLGEPELAGFLYAIAVDTITCIETTDALGLALLTVGTSTLAGVDDEIAYLAQGVARFKGGIRTPFVVPSITKHDDVSENDVLSDRFDAVRPDEENGLKLSRSETFLVNKAQFQGDTQIGQLPLIVDMAPFDLEDFIRANIEFTLLEDDSDGKNTISDIFALLQQATALGQQLVSTGSFGPLAPPLSATLSVFDKEMVFAKLNAAVQSVIKDQSRISSHDFVINANQIKAAFAASGNIRSYPQGASPPSFEYVIDRPEQVVTLKGKGGEYRVGLRYERHTII